ncbi:MAG: XdhC family protein [Vulcanimicrobiaceae bacterium]
MRDVFAAIAAWLRDGRAFAAATLVETDSAAPAPLGTTIAVDEHGAIVGDIGAGCYESDVVEACVKSLRDGQPHSVIVDLEDEIFGGTGCGARLHIISWVPPPAFEQDALAIARGDRAVTLQVPSEPPFAFTIGERQPLVVVGATSLGAELVSFARRLDFRVIVVDPRTAFATRARLPEADAIVQAWPDDVLPDLLNTATPVIVVSHDRKVDVPALACALRSRSPYIALLGSRRAQKARRETLAGEGFDDGQIARIHGPAGLDLGGATPAETALSILSELVAVRNSRSGAPLRDAAGPIHRALV